MATRSVLLTTYPEAFLQKGGGEYELLEVALNLRKLGIVADVYGPYSRDVANYDIVLHFSLVSTGLPMLRAIHDLGKEIILWPNFLNLEKRVPDPALSVQPFLDLAQTIVLKSKAERRNLENFVSLKNKNVLIVPEGVDPCFIKQPPQGLFQRCFDLEKYVLLVGSIDTMSQQLEIIKYLHKLEIQFAFIGNYRNKEYYEACKAVAPKNFIFFEAMDHKSDLFRSAMKDCALYIGLSLDHSTKSILEAGISGAKILTSDTDWSHEHFGDFAIYIDNGSMENIFDSIIDGINMNINQNQVKRLSEKHILPNALKKFSNYLQNCN